MKIKNITKKIENVIEKHNINQKLADEHAEYSFYGLRFENKLRKIGDECDWSKHNYDRQDEREFPVYGSDEYERAEQLEGTSAWSITDEGSNEWQKSYCQDDAYADDELFVDGHCYIIAGDRTAEHGAPDENEVVIADAIVIAVLF